MLLQDVFCALAALFSVWGVMALACAAALFFARPARGERCVIVLGGSCPPEAAVARVSRTLARLQVTGALRYSVIAAVCEEENAEVRAALRASFMQEPRVVICTKAEFCELFL